MARVYPLTIKLTVNKGILKTTSNSEKNFDKGNGWLVVCV